MYPRDPVNLPVIDLNDPEVLLIDSAEKFAQINDPSKRIFLVQPGNYAVDLELTQDGTPEAKRYIIYYNPSEQSEVHPANMSEADRAVIQELYFLGTEHWVVHRITARDESTHSHVRMQPNTFHWTDHWPHNNRHILLDKMLIEGGGGSSGMVAMGGEDLTVQDSVIRNSFITPNADDHGIVFYGDRNKLIGLEVYDCSGDMVQISGSGSNSGVIADCEFYVTSAYYTDGNGNLDPNGTHMAVENGMDFKGGGNVDGLLVKDNFIWGFNRDDDNNTVTGAGSIGLGIVTHSSCSNVIFEGNVLLDNQMGFIGANPTTQDCIFRDNLFKDHTYGFSMPSSKAFNNKYFDNKFDNVGTDFLSVAEGEEMSGNGPFTGYKCVMKHHITNPTEVCIGTPPANPCQAQEDEIVSLNSQIVTLNTDIAAKDAEIASKDIQIAEQTALIDSLRPLINNMKSQIDNFDA